MLLGFSCSRHFPDTEPMPKPRKLSFETPTARLRLPIQKKPHWLRLGPGLSLGYRRNEGAGTWSSAPPTGAAANG